MVYQRVTEFDFIDAFDQMDRSGNFSFPARRELFQYYDNLSDDIGEPMELDVIALCCDWMEYDEDELIREYDWLLTGDEQDDDDVLESILEGIADRSTVITVTRYGGKQTYLVLAF